MKYEDLSPEAIKSEIPYIISYLEKYEHDKKRNQDFVEFELINTDHTYSPIRLSGSRPEIINDVMYHFDNHCCVCGFQENLIPFPNDDYGFNLKICKLCDAKINGDRTSFILEQIKEKATNSHLHVPHIKIKIKVNENITYRYADEITYKNGEYHIMDKKATNKILSKSVENMFRASNLPSPTIPIEIIGTNLGIRDAKGDKVYTGDILLCQTENNNYFYGAITDMGSKWGGWFCGPNEQWQRFAILHGFGNFPSSLAYATQFKIIGSIGVIKSINNFNYAHCYESYYELWCNTYSEKVEALRKDLHNCNLELINLKNID